MRSDRAGSVWPQRTQRRHRLAWAMDIFLVYHPERDREVEAKKEIQTRENSSTGNRLPGEGVYPRIKDEERNGKNGRTSDFA